MAADKDEWLDALAGRAPAGTAPDADRLREALLPLPDTAPTRTWADVVAAATDTTGPPALPGEPAALRQASTSPAANQAPFLARPPARHQAPLAWAAVLALAVAVGAWWRMPPEPASLRGAPTDAGATWVTADPAAGSQALAADLKQAGARVQLQSRGASWLLHIEADPAVRAAVDARLQPMETALDTSGQLRLTVRSPP